MARALATAPGTVAPVPHDPADRALLARAVSAAGRGLLIRADNAGAGWRPVSQLVADDVCFAVQVDAAVLAVDCDQPGTAADRSLDQLQAALVRLGADPVVVASGRPGHRHLFVRLDDDPPAREALDEWLRRCGLDVRHAIRPPLTAHRSGAPTRLLTHASASEAAKALTGPCPVGVVAAVQDALRGPAYGAPDAPGGPAAGGDLSARMRRLIEHGHEAAGYPTPSHGRMALATAAVATGRSRQWLETVLADPASPVGKTWRSKPPRWRQVELDRLWRKATMHVATSGRPPAWRSRPEAMRHVARWAAAVGSVAWPGMSGATDVAVCEALVDLAVARGGPRLAASLPEVAVHAGISQSTARRSLRRLVSAGWLRIEQRATATLATVWRLVLPAQITGQLVLDLGGRPRGLGEDWARWGAAGKSAARAWRVLSREAVTEREVAELLRCSVNAARLRLRRLRRLGLAARAADGWVRGRRTGEQVARDLGTAGAQARDRLAWMARRRARAQVRAQWRQARQWAVQGYLTGDLALLSRAAAILPAHAMAALAPR